MNALDLHSRLRPAMVWARRVLEVPSRGDLASELERLGARLDAIERRTAAVQAGLEQLRARQRAPDHADELEILDTCIALLATHRLPPPWRTGE